MTASPVDSNESPLRERAERNLGSLVIAIEFTLISVMVGVVLFPLMDFATPILRDLDLEHMPYIVSGLLVILYIWTEVISHSLSFIGWPIDIFHNLLYILLALVLGIQMHFLSNPPAWYAITVPNAVLAGVIAYYDRKVIEHRRLNSTGAAARLFESAWQRQEGLVRTAPFTFANAVFQASLVFFFPLIFIEHKAHLVLVAIQILGFIYLIRRTILQFGATRELILGKAVEELAEEE